MIRFSLPQLLAGLVLIFDGFALPWPSEGALAVISLIGGAFLVWTGIQKIDPTGV